MVSPHVGADRVDRQLHLTPTLFVEGTTGHSLAYQGGCFGVGGGGGPQFCNAFPVGDNLEPEQHRPGRPAVHLSRRQHHRSALLRLRPAEPQRLADVGRHPRAAAADVHLGQPRRQRAAQHRLPEPEHRVEHRRLGQPDEGLGPPHDQDRLLQSIQQQAAGAGRRRGRTRAELPAGRRRHQSLRHVVRVRQRRDRLLQFLLAGLEGRRGQVHLLQHRRLRAGQLEGEPAS